MIRGIGTDAEEVARIRAALGRWGDRFLRRVYTDEEIRYCMSRADPAPSLAARYAAKEAGAKALGTGISRGVYWKHIQVTRERGRPPQLKFAGHAATLAMKLGPGIRAHLTLTHTRELAQAFVILESED